MLGEDVENSFYRFDNLSSLEITLFVEKRSWFFTPTMGGEKRVVIASEA
jgi:hypothetical protein